jgi:hypothetical protein
MENNTLALVAALALAPCLTSAQDLPLPSPKAQVEQVIGLTTVTVDYWRPSMKGRRIFGDLVPMDEMWRTGANRATIVTLSGDVQIQGQTLPGGAYSLFTIPGAEAWSVMFNKETELWGTDGYDPSAEVLRIRVQPERHAPTETFAIGVDNVTEEQATMFLAWEGVRVPIVMTADPTPQALRNIREAIAKPEADFRVYHNSARFCVDRKLMLDEALEWAKQSVAMDEKFWNLHTLARAFVAKGMMSEAMDAAERSLILARAAEYEPYVKMNEELMASIKKDRR